MDDFELIEKAGAAIGDGDQDDYVIAPTRHADALQESAPALARILRRSELTTISRAYEEKDEEAIQAQRVFKQTAGRANWAVFATTCVGALLLMSTPVAGSAGNTVQIILGACGIVSGALGSMWLFKIREGHLLERWMTARAGAETRRIRYFDLATTMPAHGPDVSDTAGSAHGDIPLPLLQLEYFRRYQLQVQRAYYRRRSEHHRRASDKMLGVSAVAIATASVATGLGGLLGGALDSRWIAIAGFAVIATGLAGFAAAKEAVNQDRRNMERFRRTLETLDGLAAKLDAVRKAAASGDREPVIQFVAAVHEQLSLEHRQWLEASENTTTTLAKLEASLAELKSGSPGTLPGPPDDVSRARTDRT